MADERMKEIRERVEAATPGPWQWEVNIEGKTVKLQGGRQRHDLTVIGFRRWGLNGAAPTFLRPNLRPGLQTCDRAETYATPAPGRAHHADWFQSIAHPDAALIENAPADLTYLLALIDELTSAPTPTSQGENS